MAVEDIRLYLSIRTCRKFKRFKRIVGPAALEYLAWFWMAVAEAAPDGDISGWDKYEIADAAAYPGDPDDLYNALVDCKFIDANNTGPISPHNWTQRQPYIYHAPRRKLQAQLASAIRWGNTSLAKQLKPKLYGKQPLNPDSNAASNADSNAPYPLPYPNTNIGKTSINNEAHTPLPTCQHPNCSNTVDQPHHTSCRSCYSNKHHTSRDPPTTRNQSFPKCPYCSREQNGIRINHQLKGCNICKPSEIE